MLRTLNVMNFKAIGEPGVALDLAPLTLFVGDNGAGKSSALEALLVLGQSANPQYRWWAVSEGAVTARDGSGAGEGFLEFVHGGPANARGRWVKIGFEAVVSHDARAPFVEAGVKAGVQARAFGAWPPSMLGYSVESRFIGKPPDEWEWRHTLTADDRVVVRSAVERQADGTMRSSVEVPWLSVEGGFRPLSGSPQEILRFTSLAVQEAARPGLAGSVNAMVAPCVDWLAALVRHHIGFLRHLRGADLDTRGADDRGLAWVGPHGEGTLALVNRLQGPTPREHVEYLRRWLARFDLSSFDTRAGKQLEGWFTDRGGTRVEVHHAAAGSRAILPVVVQVLAAERGDVLFVEEPEITQHPRWQVLLAELLLEATLDRGIQVIATTHAPDFVLAVSRAMSRRPPPADHVGVWEFRRPKDATEVERLKFQPNHRLQRWVPSFREAEDSLLDAWREQPEAPDAETSPPAVASKPSPASTRRTRRHPARGSRKSASGGSRRPARR